LSEQQADDTTPETPPPATAAADDGETRVSGSSKPGFKTDAVSDVYAQALFELAKQAETLDAVGVEMEQLGRTLDGSPDLMRLISSRALSRDDRAGLIDRIFKDHVDPTVYKFLHVINRKDRLASLPAITASFADRLSEQRGIIEVDAYVAQRLESAEADRVAEAIGAALGKQVVLHQYVDESLIGGLKVRIGDQMIDGSVATKLAKMKRDLIAAGREKARQQVAAE
jgi:F-type H+-transporting ATPase subunit delta